MIKLRVENHNVEYELQNIINIFKPYMNKGTEYTIISRVDKGQCSTKVISGNEIIAQSFQDMKVGNLPHVARNNVIRQALKKTLYIVLTQLTNQKMPWGVLTGIRPTKIVHNYKREQYNKSSINQILIEDYCISREKANLMIQIAEKEERILSKNKKDELSLYIGIPFCPTRCLYCSFTSYSLEQKGKLVEAYLDALTKEIEYVSQVTRGRAISSLYIGGGTPTSLNEKQLERLLAVLGRSFNIKNIEEYTVEAGRPDTISREKLRLMKQYGVNRISINPQTMNQKTLDVIGRLHNVGDIINVFEIAREEGHDNINMDLIVGLPEEKPVDVEDTMAQIHKLKPDSITVHTMAIKRASRLKEEIDDYNLTTGVGIGEMLEITAQGAKNMGMQPYYMYRQKDILGNFENVGYAMPGKECIYNIQMIAEQQTIIAMGAGAVTKIVSEDGKKIERIPNVRNLEEYIQRIDEMIGRKGTVHKS